VRLASSILFVVLVLAIQGPGSAARAQQKPELAAEKSAKAWLALVDAGKYAKSWDEAAQYFKGAVSEKDWQKALEARRMPLGKTLSRKLERANFTRTLPGAPDGQYVVMKYATSFQNKKSAVETVTFLLDRDGEWRAAGYFIR
jgi:Protein of unknown function (DUF4019)